MPAGLAITPSSPAPSKLLEPVRRQRAVARHRREVDAAARRWPSSSSSGARRSACGAAIRLLPVRRQQIEGDERGGRLLRELRHARGRGMQPQLQRVEVEPALRGDHDLAVDHAARRQLLAAARRAARESSGRAAAGRGSGCRASDVAAKHDRAEAVPLRLEQIRALRRAARRRASRASARSAARSETRLPWGAWPSITSPFFDV